MASKKSQTKLIGLVVTAVLALGTMFTLFLNTIKVKLSGSIGGFGTSSDWNYYKLFSDLFQDTDYQGLYGAIKAFAVVALVVAILLIAVCALTYVEKKFGKLLLPASALLVLVEVVSIVLTIVLCSKVSGTASAGSGLISGTATYKAAVGMYIGWVCGILSGVTGCYFGTRK